MARTTCTVLLVFVLCTGESAAVETGRGTDKSEKGQIVKKQLRYGEYFQYVPRSLKYSAQARFVVIAHGSLKGSDRASVSAERFIKRWTKVAEKRQLILLAPVFTKETFGSSYEKAGPGGGYRGLFGRDIGADDFVNLIVDRYRAYSPTFDGRFYLYGHSAGGQFTNRYIVRHPERVIAAVISAAGRYTFPDANAPWPYGMGRLRRRLRWSNSQDAKQIDIQPDPSGWVAAAALPVTVVVGGDDTKRMTDRPGQKGSNRIEIARHWVEDMNRLGASEKRRKMFYLRVVPKIGHSSSRLTPYCIERLFSRAAKGQSDPDKARSTLLVLGGDPHCDDNWLKEWELVAESGHKFLETEGERKGVLQTHPISAHQPFVFKRSVNIRRSGKTSLAIGVHGVNDFELEVMLNEKCVYRRTIHRWWEDISVDLSKWRNQKVEIEVLHKAGGVEKWNREEGFFDYIAVVHR